MWIRVFQELRPEVKVTMALNSMQHSTTPLCILKSNLGCLFHIVKGLCSVHDLKRTEVKVKVTVTPN